MKFKLAGFLLVIVVFMLIAIGAQVKASGIEDRIAEICDSSTKSGEIGYLCSLKERVVSLQTKLLNLGNCSDNFTDNGDGTIMDNCTSHEWQKQTSSALIWDDAVTYCSNLTLAGNHDWKLPTEYQLVKLMEFRNDGPAFISPIFEWAVAGQFGGWSSTEASVGTPNNFAYAVRFDTGNSTYIPKTALYYARCIR